MKRQIIKIDTEKCDGCGACVMACHEGAIGLADGKAVLLRDDYCDGLGNCLPVCPAGAISFEEREAAAYDEAAVNAKESGRNAARKNENLAEEGELRAAFQHISRTNAPDGREPRECGCPGSRPHTLIRADARSSENGMGGRRDDDETRESELAQWPVQIKLVPINAPYLTGANLLVAADCAAYAHASFHRDFMRNRVTIIGCPKLDEGDYTEKLTAILSENDIKSLTVVRMEVPCCGGLANAATEALRASGKFIPWQIVTLSTDGKQI